MSDLEVFGPLVLSTDVESAVEATLKRWMTDYLRWVERTKNLRVNFLPTPRSYTITSDWDHFPEDQLPAVLIMCAKADNPKMDGRREYRATFPVRVGVIVSAKDRNSTERLAKYYGGALRALLLAKGSLGNFAVQTCWDGENYDVHTADRSQRTLATAEVKLTVEVRNVVRRLAGPLEPSPKPAESAPPWPTVSKETPIVLNPL
jgi:hypothetical protein